MVESCRNCGASLNAGQVICPVCSITVQAENNLSALPNKLQNLNEHHSLNVFDPAIKITPTTSKYVNKVTYTVGGVPLLHFLMFTIVAMALVFGCVWGVYSIYKWWDEGSQITKPQGSQSANESAATHSALEISLVNFSTDAPVIATGKKYRNSYYLGGHALFNNPTDDSLTFVSGSLEGIDGSQILLFPVEDLGDGPLLEGDEIGVAANGFRSLYFWTDRSLRNTTNYRAKFAFRRDRDSSDIAAEAILKPDKDGESVGYSRAEEKLAMAQAEEAERKKAAEVEKREQQEAKQAEAHKAREAKLAEEARRKEEARPRILAAAPEMRREAIEWRLGTRANVDHVKAKQLLDEAAEAGDGRSIALKYLYQDGWILPNPSDRETSKNETLSTSIIAEIEKDALAGDPEANFIVGFLNINHNLQKAREYLERGADADDLSSIAILAQLLLNEEDPASTERALNLLDSAARQECAGAAVILGHTFRTGVRVTTDTARAAQYYTFAAKKQHPEAIGWLGNAYYTGEGVTTDTQKGMEYFLQAADLGVVAAQAQLGQILYNSSLAPDAPPDNLVRAVHYIELAVNNGYIENVGLLASFYFNGLGVEKDCEKAVMYAETGSNAGQMSAKVILANCQATGCGVPQNLLSGIRALTQYARSGSSEAMYSLSQIYKSPNSDFYNPKLSHEWLAWALKYGYAVSQSEFQASAQRATQAAVARNGNQSNHHAQSTNAHKPVQTGVIEFLYPEEVAQFRQAKRQYIDTVNSSMEMSFGLGGVSVDTKAPILVDRHGRVIERAYP